MDLKGGLVDNNKQEGVNLMCLKIEEGKISTLGTPDYLNAEGERISGSGTSISSEMIHQEEWLETDGELIRLVLGDFQLLDIEGYIQIIPSNLMVLGNIKNGVIKVICAKAVGAIIEFSDLMPFLHESELST